MKGRGILRCPTGPFRIRPAPRATRAVRWRPAWARRAPQRAPLSHDSMFASSLPMAAAIPRPLGAAVARPTLRHCRPWRRSPIPRHCCPINSRRTPSRLAEGGAAGPGPCSEQVVQMPPLEQIELQKAQDFAQLPASAAEELHVARQQVHAHGDPQLRRHGVARRANEALHLQVLLDPLEERLHLPARLVDVRDGLRRQIEVRRQEDAALPRVRAAAADPAQPAWAPPAARALVSSMVWSDVTPSRRFASRLSTTRYLTPS